MTGLFSLCDIYCVIFALYSAKRCIAALSTKYDGKCIGLACLTREPENDTMTHGDTEGGVIRIHSLWLSVPKFTEITDRFHFNKN